MEVNGCKKHLKLSERTDEHDVDEIPETQQCKIQKKYLLHKLGSTGDIPLQTVTKQIMNKITFENVNNTELFNEIDFDDDFIDEMEKENQSCSQKSFILFSPPASSPSLQMNLKLNTWKRCLVESITRDLKTFDQILIIREDLSNDATLASEKAMCRLQDAWCHCKIFPNDIVSLYGTWNESLECYCINNISGFIITSPDNLISGTSVVGSLFCQRKAILSNQFKGIDSGNKIMTIGSIVHELLQTVLKRKLTKLDEIMHVINTILKNQQIIYDLYACDMTVDEAREEIEKYLDNIVKFINEYIIGANIDKNDKTLFNGKIDSIQDIEENIWVPKLGVKGKIDVSVKVRPRNNFFDVSAKYMPLELKTGRASYSSEHKGQLILYQMMLKEVGEFVESGLLLYLKDGTMKEIPGTRNEQRDIILLRNELSYYLTRKLQMKNDLEFELPELPEPINHFACNTCPYNIICCTYLNRDNKIELSQKHPLKKISQTITSHLTKTHIDYFIQWTGMLTLEEEECRKGNQLKNVWTQSPELRQAQGTAINDLILIESIVSKDDNTILHRFKKNCESQTNSIACNNNNLMLYNITIGDYLIVSTKHRISIAAGRVIDINKLEITLSLERNLNERYFNNVFILDKYESQSLGTFNMTNIGVLLDETDESLRLRNIIIDRCIPTFTKKLPTIISTEGTKILLTLNRSQRMAALKALTTNDYMLIKGLPGTGKTKTIVAIIRLFYLMNKSILITSHTHSAVDNVLIKLLDYKLNFLRLGTATHKIMTELHPFCESTLMGNCTTTQDLKNLYSEHKIVGVTCLGSSHPMLVQRKFDMCLVDEATQVLQCTVIRPLLCAQKFILIGDPEQLPPIVRSKEAKNLGADESLFTRLDLNEQTTIVLTQQYRMNKTITKLANILTYNGKLNCANNVISNSTLNLPNFDAITREFAKEKWLIKTLSSHIDQSVILLDTGNSFLKNLDFMDSQNAKSDNSNSYSSKSSSSSASSSKCDTNESNKFKNRIYTNYCEAAVCIYIVDALIKCGVKESAIGVIAPYRSQVDLLKYLINLAVKHNLFNQQQFENIEVNTVDQYQGRDKEIIIYSCTKSTELQHIVNDMEILEDQRRLTVAITRSKYKLIIIGDENCLINYRPFKILFGNLSKLSKLKLINGQYGFFWDTMLNYLQLIISSDETVNRNSTEDYNL